MGLIEAIVPMVRSDPVPVREYFLCYRARFGILPLLSGFSLERCGTDTNQLKLDDTYLLVRHTYFQIHPYSPNTKKTMSLS